MRGRGGSSSRPGRLRETGAPTSGDVIGRDRGHRRMRLLGSCRAYAGATGSGALPGTLTVLTTMDYAFRRDVWLRLADEVRWHEVPVPHATSFLQPHADVLGNTIAEIVHEALEPVR